MWRPSVLIAEDNDDLRQLYILTLSCRGFEVRMASDGREALDELRQRRPDVLVTDVMMPQMDGVELIRQVREEPELKDLPIIAFSAFPDYLSKAYLSGATETIRKPMDLDALFDALLRVLPQGKTLEH
ncbi:MAG TPA: response regulator [Blastocatellia bacterium]|nr:response regulator [Blastocatellia bacterium]